METKNVIGIYSVDGRLRGAAHEDEVHKNSRPHMSVRVWLVHGDAIWFQRRPDGVTAAPGKLAPCACGHVAAGEEPVAAAVRCYVDQTGSAIGPEDLVLAGVVPMPTDLPGGALDDEFAWIYVHNPDMLPKAQSEPSGGRFVPVPLENYRRVAGMPDRPDDRTGFRSAFRNADPLEFGLVYRALERGWAGWTG